MIAPRPVDLPNRRDWLRSAACLAAIPGSTSFAQVSDEAEVAAVRDDARKAGLPDLRVSRNDSYLAVGDAPQAFQHRALEILLGLSRDFLRHFTDKGFRVEKPSARMTVIVLSGRPAFDAYLGAPQDKAVCGVYDLGTSRLIMFDNATRPATPTRRRRTRWFCSTRPPTNSPSAPACWTASPTPHWPSTKAWAPTASREA